MPSRLVENLYWFGRYTARCEDKTRLLRGTLAARSEAGVWRFAVKFCRELGVLAIDAEPSAALRDDENPFGIVADLRRLGWCASQVRSRLSASCWRAVGELQRALQPASVRRDEPREALDRLLLSLAALAGFALDEMTQDEAWRLLRIGRRLERLQFLARLLARHLTSDSATQQSRIEWLLEACDSLRVYRPRYAVAPRLGPTLDLLIRDVEHPRALAFQAHAIARDLAVLAASLRGSSEVRLDEPIPALSDEELVALEAADAMAGTLRARLATRLHALGAAAAQLSDRISMRHFSHTGLDAQALAT